MRRLAFITIMLLLACVAWAACWCDTKGDHIAGVSNMMPAYGISSSQAYSASSVGVVVAYGGAVVKHGGNQYGFWLDIADTDTVSSPTGGTVRVWRHERAFVPAEDASVVVEGRLTRPGIMWASRITFLLNGTDKPRVK